MKRILLSLALIGALGATAASAQARVSVSIGFGVPAPYVVYRPRPYHYFYEPYRVVVVERPLYRRAPLLVIRRHGWRGYHRRHW